MLPKSQEAEERRPVAEEKQFYGATCEPSPSSPQGPMSLGYGVNELPLSAQLPSTWSQPKATRPRRSKKTLAQAQ